MRRRVSARTSGATGANALCLAPEAKDLAHAARRLRESLATPQIVQVKYKRYIASKWRFDYVQ